MIDPCARRYRSQSLAAFASLLSDPIRAAIVLALSDGHERSAGDLAAVAGASPQAATPHLAKLINGGLLSVTQQGRFRLYRIVTGEMAEMVEALSNLVEHPPVGHQPPELRQARMCYDHLAGRLGCAIYKCFLERGFICAGSDGPILSGTGTEWCGRHGIRLGNRTPSRRRLVHLCRDWTEDQPHLGGVLGASLADMLRRRGLVRQEPNGRIVEVLPDGWTFLQAELSLTRASLRFPPTQMVTVERLPSIELQ